MHQLRLMSSQETNSALGAAFSSGCLPACHLCPVLFVLWGGLREGPEVPEDKVFSLPSENRVTPSLFLLWPLRLWGRGISGSNPTSPTSLWVAVGRSLCPLCASVSSSLKRGGGGHHLPGLF